MLSRSGPPAGSSKLHATASTAFWIAFLFWRVSASSRLTYRGENPELAARPEGEQDATDIIVERITSPAFLAVHRGYT